MTPPPTVTPARPEIVTRGVPARRPGWIERATDANHKSAALLFIGGSLSFLILALTEFVLMRVQLIVPENTLIAPDIFDRLVSASGVTAMVLFAVPLALGVIGYVVPLQIGARGVAFPRLNLLSAWLFIAGGATIYASFLYTPSEAGTVALPPLSDAVFSPSHGADAWIMGTALAVVGFVCFAVNLVTTVTSMRAPGIAWRRLPLFSWAATVIGYLLLVAGPVMLAALTMLTIDRHFNGVFFDSGEGGAPVLYEHLAWIFFTGTYLTVLLFAAGTISEILPTFARKPIFSRATAMAAMVAIAAIGLLAWMQNMYIAPIPIGWAYFAMAMALALVVPIGLLFYVWIGTLVQGAITTRAPMLYALGAIATLAIGLCGELMSSVVPVGWQLEQTTAVQGDTFLVLVGGAVLGGFAALHYWLPKVTGRTIDEGMAQLAFWPIVLGAQLYTWPMFLAGLAGQPVDVYKYFDTGHLATFNLIASIGAFVFVLGVVIEVVNVARGYHHGVEVGHDPWGGTTLEWFALSPPPSHNFDAVPDVRSAEPMRDIREAIRRRTEAWEAPEPLSTPAPVADPASADGEGAEASPAGDAADEDASVS